MGEDPTGPRGGDCGRPRDLTDTWGFSAHVAPSCLHKPACPFCPGLGAPRRNTTPRRCSLAQGQLRAAQGHAPYMQAPGKPRSRWGLQVRHWVHLWTQSLSFLQAPFWLKTYIYISSCCPLLAVMFEARAITEPLPCGPVVGTIPGSAGRGSHGMRKCEGSGAGRLGPTALL